MKIKIDLYTPTTGVKITQATFKKTTGSKFLKLFDSNPISKIPALGFRQLIRFALDSGYGAPNGLGQSPFLKMPAADKVRLSDYLRTRLHLVRHLLEESHTGHIQKHSVAKYLESSDMADVSFLLGTLGCRYATEQWLRTKKTGLKRFWHFTLYSSPLATGMNFSFSALKSGRKRRPDFLVEDTDDNWYAVEAKGTSGLLNKAELLSGMQQASRLRKITLIAAGHSTSKTHRISDYACSSTYFDKNNELAVCFVDPPTETESNPEEETFAIFEELAVILDFFRATQQFRLLGAYGSARARSELPTRSGARWALFSAEWDTSSGSNIWIGIIEEVLLNETKMRNVLRVVEVLIPALRDTYTRLQHGEARELAFALRQARERLLEIEYHRTTWNTVHRLVAKKLLTWSDTDNLPQTWREAVASLLDKPIFIDGPGATIKELADALTRVVKSASMVQEISARIDQLDEASSFETKAMRNGLLVGGGIWRPSPFTLQPRRRKI